MPKAKSPFGRPPLSPLAVPIEARPFAKSAGGKTKLLPLILPKLPATITGTYCEPFVGGGAVFFALVAAGRIRKAVLSDSNPDLVAAYRAVKSDVEVLIERLRLAKNTKEDFLAVRAQDTSGMCDVRRGARFLYLNKTAFNGLWRVNQKGQHNVPWAGYKNPTLCDEEGLRAASRALQIATIVHADFSDVFGSVKVGAGDAIYCDPPYFPKSKTANFTGYAKDGFQEADQARLESEAGMARSRGARVVLSNADTVAARALYDKPFWDLHAVSVRHNVGAKADWRGDTGELIIVGRTTPRVVSKSAAGA